MLTLNGRERNDGSPPEDFSLQDGCDPVTGEPIHPPEQLELPTKKKRKFKREKNYGKSLVKQSGPKRRGGGK